MVKIKNFWWELSSFLMILVPVTFFTTTGFTVAVVLISKLFNIPLKDIWSYEFATIKEELIAYLILLVMALIVFILCFLAHKVASIIFRRDFWNEPHLNLPIGHTADESNKIIRQLVPRYKKACVVCIRYTHKELEDAVWYMKEHHVKFRALPPGYTLPDNLGYLQPHIQLCTAKKLLKYVDAKHPIVLIYKVRYPRSSQLKHTVKYVMDPSKE